MAVITVWIKINEERVVEGLQDSAEGEVVVDFSSVRRINPSAIRALEGFADAADGKGVKVVLRGVNVDVYKVLKLVKLGSRLSFVA